MTSLVPGIHEAGAAGAAAEFTGVFLLFQSQVCDGAPAVPKRQPAAITLSWLVIGRHKANTHYQQLMQMICTPGSNRRNEFFHEYLVTASKSCLLMAALYKV